MHIQLKNGKLLNSDNINNVRQGFKNKNNVIIELTNGLKILEGRYETDMDAQTRTEELRNQLIS